MVKHLNIILEDHEYELLRQTKGRRSWHDFLIQQDKKKE